MTKETLKTAEASLTIHLDGPDWDGAPAATIGTFKSKTPEAADDILQQALERIRAAGRDRVLGPMAGNTWHSYRFVSQSDGSAPFMMEPTNAAHEPGVFRTAGFAPVSQYFSARLLLEHAVASAPPPTDALTVEHWDGQDPEGLFRQVFALSSEAFSRNAFYQPTSEDAFLAMYMPVVPMLKPDLILFARRPDGSLAGFLFAIPNFAEGPQTKTVILKTYASLERGAGGALVHTCEATAQTMGFETIIHALIHDSNQSAQRSAARGAEVFRRYELLGLRLDV